MYKQWDILLGNLLLTRTPIRYIMVLCSGWWALELTFQLFTTTPIYSWSMIAQYGSPILWVIIWWCITFLEIYAIYKPAQTVRRKVCMIAAFFWIFNGVMLLQTIDVIVPMTGYSFIFAVTELWSYVRSKYVHIAYTEGPLYERPQPRA